MTPKYLIPLAVLIVGCSAEEPQSAPVETVEFSQVIVEATGGKDTPGGKKAPGRVQHLPQVQRNDQGTPLVSDIFEQARRHRLFLTPCPGKSFHPPAGILPLSAVAPAPAPARTVA